MVRKTADAVVSMVAHCRSAETADTPLMRVLSGIQKGEWRECVEAVRRAGKQYGKAGADRCKKKLPGVLFSGRFSRRDADHLLEHSGLLCADLDHLNELKTARRGIESDPCTFACFVSPSGTGLKVLYRIPPKAETHEAAFMAVTTHLRDRHGVEADPKCKDVSRLCFVSDDPELYLNTHSREIKCDIDHTDHLDHISNLARQLPHEPDPEQQQSEKKPIWSISHPEKVQAVIEQTRPRQPGERHRCVFNLARGLKHDAGLHDAPMPELKKIVRRWFTIALPNIATKDFSETWSDFVHAWDRVRTPLADGPISKAWHLVETEPLPGVCRDYDGERARKLLALCWHLRRGDRTFYLSMPVAGQMMKVHPYQVRRYIRMFIADGLLIVVKAGTRQTATTYRWLPC